LEITKDELEKIIISLDNMADKLQRSLGKWLLLATANGNTSVYNNASSNATMSCYIMIFKIQEMPAIFTTGTYVNILKG
jgi:hypothetical protein